jgi:ABC-2 type transport system permease protein
MRSVYAIAKKELWGFFLSPVAYVVLAVFLLVQGIFFWLYLAYLSQPGAYSIAPLSLFFGGGLLWFLVIPLAPVVTMRLGAEELKTGTVETLMTAPVSDLEVVSGKYLGAMALYVAAWLPTVLYVVILRSYSTVDMGPVYGGYLGVLLLGFFFIAVGLFASFVSKNQVVAFLLAFAILLLLLLLSFLSGLVTSTFWKGLWNYVNLVSILQDFARGIVSTKAVTYFVSGAALFLTLSYQALQTRRWR